MERPFTALIVSMRSNPVLLFIILGSLILHALLVTAAFLTPKEPPPPRHPWTDCDAQSQPTAATGEHAGASLSTGTGDGRGGPGTGAGGSSGALGPRVFTTLEMRYLPCCGPGCIEPMEISDN